MAAVALGVGTTLLGLLDIRRLVTYLRGRMGWSGEKQAQPSSKLVDGGLQALGAVLLILPGFASDLVGLALKSPPIRGDIAQRLRGGGARKGHARSTSRLTNGKAWITANRDGAARAPNPAACCRPLPTTKQGNRFRLTRRRGVEGYEFMGASLDSEPTMSSAVRPPL